MLVMIAKYSPPNDNIQWLPKLIMTGAILYRQESVTAMSYI